MNEDALKQCCYLISKFDLTRMALASFRKRESALPDKAEYAGNEAT